MSKRHVPSLQVCASIVSKVFVVFANAAPDLIVEIALQQKIVKEITFLLF